MTAAPSAGTTTTGAWIVLAHELGSAIESGAKERDRKGEISPTVFDSLRSRGLVGALVPTEFGGGGASHTDMGAMLRVLGRYDGPTAVTLSMHAHLVAAQVWRHRHGQDARGVLQRVGENGAILISTGASDWVSSNGVATRVDGGFSVSARKTPASGCEVGNVLATSVRWDGSPDGPQVIHCSVPFAAEGVAIDPTWDTLGMRATGSHTVVLTDVFVPDAAVSLMRPADVWHPFWNVVVGAALPLIMASYVGVADAAIEIARTVCTDRSEPHVLQLLGEMMNAHTTAADLVDAMFREADDLQFANTDDLAARVLSRKTVAADALIQAVRLAIEATGGLGFTRASPLERLYRDIHGCLFHPLPRAKQTRFTGRVALGLTPTD